MNNINISNKDSENYINKTTKINDKIMDYTKISERIQVTISYTIKLMLLIAVIHSAINQAWLTLVLSIVTLFLTVLPAIIKRNYKVSLPIEFELVFVIFLYISILLGLAYNYYTRYWWWDIIVHSMSGIILAFIGFIILYTLYSENMIKASPHIIALFSFCFALALGAVWEIIEFTLDQSLGLNMQRGSLLDTMGDFIVDSASALLVSTLGYFYIKNKKAYIIDGLIKKFVQKNPQIFKEITLQK